MILLIASLAGCSIGPDYHRPGALGASPLPSHLGDPSITNAGEWKIAEPSVRLPRGRWWELFGDPELNRLESLAATNNQQLAAAVANFDEARAAVRVARAAFYPQLNGAPTWTRQRTSANGSPTSASASHSITFNNFNVSADASWELDLWGRIRRQTESARAQFSASADDLASAQLSIQAEVAMDYFTLRSLDAQAKLFAAAADDYQKALDLTKNRRASGVASGLDVAEAETQLKSARAQIPAVELQRAQTRHALAVLSGEAATGFALTLNSTVTTNLPAIPVSVPSEWLEQRPDVASAERKMAAANASVGAAKAAFYPRVILSGSAGWQSVSASTLFDWPSRVWAVGPSLQFPLFTGGLNRAQLASAKAAYEGAVATYRQTVLAAFQDVEDQLAGQVLLSRQLTAEEEAMEAAERARDISNNQYKAGVETYLNVISAQTTALTHEQTVIQLRGQRLNASVALIKALGAGWRAVEETASAP